MNAKNRTDTQPTDKQRAYALGVRAGKRGITTLEGDREFLAMVPQGGGFREGLRVAGLVSAWETGCLRGQMKARFDAKARAQEGAQGRGRVKAF